MKNFTIEGDSLIVIFALQFSVIIQDWHIENVILDTLALLSPSSMREAKKINRSANSAPIMWHIEPRQEFTWAAFPSFPVVI
jgi:hypothetical protein